MRWNEWAAGLRDKCRDAECRYPGLALDLIRLYPCRNMLPGELISTLQQRIGSPPNVEIEFLEDDLVACFYGNMDGYQEFQRIGHEACAWLRATDPGLSAKSYHGWLMTLYDITKHCPAAGFEVAQNPTLPNATGIAPHVLTEDIEVFYEVTRYTRSPFVLSGAAFDMFLAPYQTRFLRESSLKVHLVPWQLRCAFANPRIVLQEPERIVASGLKNTMAALGCNGPSRRPRFFLGPNASGTLWLAGRKVLTVRAGSTAICAILLAFQESDWPEDMDTPAFPGPGGLDPAHAARDVVDKLNRRQKGPLRIKFEAVNSGLRLHWEVVSEQ